MKKHIYIVLVENKPGVLNRITSLCRQRRCNIECLTAAPTENPKISHISFEVKLDNDPAVQLEKQIQKIIPVITVKRSLSEKTITQELALIHVAFTEEQRSEVLQIAENLQATSLEMHPDHIIFKIVDTPKNIQSFLEMLTSFDIKEVKRTGIISLNTRLIFFYAVEQQS